jgi:hypothetical protein
MSVVENRQGPKDFERPGSQAKFVLFGGVVRRRPTEFPVASSSVSVGSASRTQIVPMAMAM